jgi:hypothetical protein
VGKREQAKRIAAEEARIVEIAAQHDAPDVECRQLVKDITKMKKPALMKELKQRELDVKGKQDELSTRLLGAIEADKDVADEEKRDAAMSEEEKLSWEVADYLEIGRVVHSRTYRVVLLLLMVGNVHGHDASSFAMLSNFDVSQHPIMMVWPFVVLVVSCHVLLHVALRCIDRKCVHHIQFDG